MASSGIFREPFWSLSTAFVNHYECCTTAAFLRRCAIPLGSPYGKELHPRRIDNVRKLRRSELECVCRSCCQRSEIRSERWACLAFGRRFLTLVLAVRRSPNHAQTHHRSSTLVMRARECDLLGKKANRKARSISFSHIRNKKVQHVNLQWKRFFSEDLGRKVRLRLSTKGIKTVNKIGSIDAAAKKFDVNLKNF